MKWTRFDLFLQMLGVIKINGHSTVKNQLIKNRKCKSYQRIFFHGNECCIFDIKYYNQRKNSLALLQLSHWVEIFLVYFACCTLKIMSIWYDICVNSWLYFKINLVYATLAIHWLSYLLYIALTMIDWMTLLIWIRINIIRSFFVHLYKTIQ